MLNKMTIMICFLLLSTSQLRADILSPFELDMSSEEDLQQIIGNKLTICSAGGIVRVEFKHDHRVIYTKHPRYDLGKFELSAKNATRVETEWFVDGKNICEKEIGVQNEKIINCRKISRANRNGYFFVEHDEQGSANHYTMQECSSLRFDCFCVSYNTF
ncbi:hypothetical protein [Roseibium sediminicola]|uniref:Uncharacterized protein n=1 Tax=Roseibium sediminicola TaxID=2933272 RepID=A0ABT0H4C8_9HYPH|nr:hypothetical protein [Roseibium sp. CAU 1639]MCK7615958.1 hypothetical protein [Roseibium sp. CAU 1639]